MDPRLDRIPHFDPRSCNFPIRALLGTPKAPITNFWDCPIVLDQGREGACVGFSWSHQLATAPIKRSDINDDSARVVYNTAKRLDRYPGEDYEGTTVLAGVKAVKKLYPDSFKGYHWAFGLDDVLETLAYFGPVVLGINWYTSMYNPRQGKIHIAGSVAGGHAICARGVDVQKGCVMLHNSWGSDWGFHGDAFISFNDLRRLLKEGGEACVPVY